MFDPASYDLAESFLSDVPRLNGEMWRRELAQLIQDTVESYISTTHDGEEGEFDEPEREAHDRIAELFDNQRKRQVPLL